MNGCAADDTPFTVTVAVALMLAVLEKLVALMIATQVPCGLVAVYAVQFTEPVVVAPMTISEAANTAAEGLPTESATK